MVGHWFEYRQSGSRTQPLNQTHCTACLCFPFVIRSEKPGNTLQLGKLRPKGFVPTVTQPGNGWMGLESSSPNSQTLAHSLTLGDSICLQDVVSLSSWEVLNTSDGSGESTLSRGSGGQWQRAIISDSIPQSLSNTQILLYILQWRQMLPRNILTVKMYFLSFKFRGKFHHIVLNVTTHFLAITAKKNVFSHGHLD